MSVSRRRLDTFNFSDMELNISKPQNSKVGRVRDRLLVAEDIQRVQLRDMERWFPGFPNLVHLRDISVSWSHFTAMSCVPQRARLSL
ncbi:hypothetical protein HAX54_047898, partial [Datura stramonium]|nr:hypothetical protein [Datura stramonium]